MDNKDVPVVIAQARVDSLTALLEKMMDDDDVTVATLQLTREKLTSAITLLDALLKSRARAASPVSPSSTQQVEFRDKRPPHEKFLERVFPKTFLFWSKLFCFGQNRDSMLRS